MAEPNFMQWHREFMGVWKFDTPTWQHKGIEFFIVGHNASHNFFLGVDPKSGKTYWLATCEGRRKGVFVVDGDMVEVNPDDPSVYIGHM